MHLLDFAHQAYFLEEIRRRVSVDPVDFLQKWGWLIGILWLGFVIFRAAIRPEAAQQERQMNWLRDSIIVCIRRFEALSLAYETTGADSEQVRKARAEYLLALTSAIREALATVPGERREQYRDMLASLMVNYYGSRESFPPTLFSNVLSPVTPVMTILEEMAKKTGEDEAKN
jgi:hypothetical protein